MWLSKNKHFLKSTPRTIWNDRSAALGAKLLFGLSVSFLVLSWIIYRIVPPEIPLFFSRPWGSAQLAPASSLLAVALAGMITALAHFFAAARSYTHHPLISKILIWAGVYLLAVAIFVMTTVYFRVGPR